MKTILLLVALAFISLEGEARSVRLKRSLKEVEANTCIKELLLDEEEIVEISNLRYAPEDDRDYIKFMECYWTKKGYLYEDGSVNYHDIRQMILDVFSEDFTEEFSENVANTILGNCRNIEATSPGQRAIKVENCILRGLRRMTEDF